MKTIYEGLKVLDLSDENGAYASRMLASWGAEVLKIEKPGGGEDRMQGPFVGEIPDKEKSVTFIYQNAGKKSLTLNIEIDEGKAILKQLVKDADVLIETFEPGYLTSLGLGYEDLKAVNPSLIMASITPFGQFGPHSHWKAATDLITDAMGGPMSDRGRINQAPLHLGYGMMSSAASLFALFEIQAAYHDRLFTGEGCYIDLSQQEAYAEWKDQCIGDAQLNDARQVRVGGPDYALPFIRTSDGGLVFASIATKWDAMMKWMSEEGIDISQFDDPFYQNYITEIQTPINQPLMAAFNKMGEKYTKLTFMEEAQKRGFPMAAVEACHTLPDNPHLKERQFFVEIDHPVAGKILYPGPAAKMSESDQIMDVPSPRLGQHTMEILKDLGYSDWQIEEFAACGII